MLHCKLVAFLLLNLSVLIFALTDSFGRRRGCDCNPQDQVCQCSLRGIDDISTQVLPHCSAVWHTLNLSLNPIRKLKKKQFMSSQCVNLKRLILSASTLHGQLVNLTFDGMERLLYLNMSRNGLNEIKGSPFRGCIRLETLILSDNRLHVLLQDSFQGLEALKTINLRGNFIDLVQSDTFHSLIRLRQLDLSHNNLTRLRRDLFRGLSGLQTLDLRQNPISLIHSNIFRYTPNLITLFFGTNNLAGSLQVLPRGLFIGLTKLMHLNITQCRLEDVQEDMFAGLVRLKILSIHGNYLVNVSRKIWRHTPLLQTLDLSHNQIQCIFDGNFASLTVLQNLNLSSNNIAYLSRRALYGLEHLRELRLDGNPIVRFEPSVFCHLSRLIRLNLRAIQMTENEIFSSLIDIVKNSKVITDFGLLRGISKSSCSSSVMSLTLESDDTRAKHERCPVVFGAVNLGRSRHLLIVIVALCILFLIAATSSILIYRAWSKKRRRFQYSSTTGNQVLLPQQIMIEETEAPKPLTDSFSEREKARYRLSFNPESQMQHLAIV